MKVILIGLLTSSIFTAISASDRGIPHKVLGNATSSVLEVLNAVRAEVEPLASGMQFLVSKKSNLEKEHNSTICLQSTFHNVLAYVCLVHLLCVCS